MTLNPRWATALQIGLALFLLGAASAVGWGAAFQITGRLHGAPPEGRMQALSWALAHPWPGVAVGMLVQAVLGFAGYLALLRWPRRRTVPEFQVGLPRALGEFAVGALLGLAYVSTVMLGIAALGGWRFDGWRSETSVGLWAVPIAIGLGAAFLEESVFRGLLLRQLDERYGPTVAITVVSVVFGLLHLTNTEAHGSAVWLGAAAIVLEAGLLLCAAWYLTRRLWLVIGLHAAWNATLAGVFGAPVSGIALPGGGLLRGQFTGPDWLTGGSFGPEASVLAVAVGLVLGVALLRRSRAWVGKPADGAGVPR